VLIGARNAAEIADALRLRALEIPAALWESLADVSAAAHGAAATREEGKS
jgi:hypothetical protein